MRSHYDDTHRTEELFRAVQECSLKEVRRLLREGVNPNTLLRRKGGLSPFHLSVGLGGPKAVDIVAVLLDSRGNPNVKSADGLTPLHIAAMWGHLQAVELLVNSDADIELCDNEGKTALILAQETGQYHVARYLDKLQRHIDTAVREAELACARMDQHRHSQGKEFSRLSQHLIHLHQEELRAAQQGSNILSQSDSLDSDNNSTKTCNNIKLNIPAQNKKSQQAKDAFTQFPDKNINRDQDDRRLQWQSWVTRVSESTPGAKKQQNVMNMRSFTGPDMSGYSLPLSNCLKGAPMIDVSLKEEELCGAFQPSKQCFNYILLDSRLTKNLPCRAARLPLQECFRVFVSALFHVGRGKRSRPLAHLQEATIRTKDSSKVKRIRSIWHAGYGVVNIPVGYHGMSTEESLTREALIISALGISNVTNVKGGTLYPPTNAWSSAVCSEVGVVLLFRAMLVYLAQGERQYHRNDL